MKNCQIILMSDVFGNFFLQNKNYYEYCNHAEWLNYDDLKIDVSAVIVSGGHYYAK